jgi:AraC family transcriptional regulator
MTRPVPLMEQRVARRLDHGQNFGAITASVRSADLCINAAEHAPRMVVPHHEHANAYLCVVMAGRLEIRARTTVVCGAASLVTYPAGHAHSNRFGDEPGRCINIHFGPTWFEERALRAWLRECRHLEIGAGAHSLFLLAQELQASDEAAPLAAASAAIDVLAEAMRADVSASRPKWLARVVEIIEADLAQAPGLGCLASEVGAHPAHVARLFRQTYGETLGAYVRRRRVEQADRALTQGNQPLAAIAAAAGFSDQAHFTRVFHRHFGVTPGVRRRLRNSRSKPAAVFKTRVS